MYNAALLGSPSKQRIAAEYYVLPTDLCLTISVATHCEKVRTIWLGHQPSFDHAAEVVLVFLT